MSRNSESQDRVYSFIRDFVMKNLYAPSIREICSGCGFESTSTVHNHLCNLVDKGLIEIPNYNSPRCIRLLGFKVVADED